MRFALLVAFLSLPLVSCASKPESVYIPKDVKIPVPISVKVPEISRPEWPTMGLTPKSDIFTQVKALLAEIELRESYEIKMRAALKSIGGK